MSYDLGVWRPAESQISVDEAARIYSDLCSRPFDSFVPGNEMTAFVDSVVERYRAESLTNDDPWAAEPDIGESCAILPIQSALNRRVFPIVRDLAREYGLICFDPQESVVFQPGPGGRSVSFTLELSDGCVIDGPDEGHIEASVRKLSETNWFVVLERGRNHYLQAGYGDRVGAPEGRFVIEYRDGSVTRHRRAYADTAAKVLAAFLGYLNGDMDWAEEYSWVPVQ